MLCIGLLRIYLGSERKRISWDRIYLGRVEEDLQGNQLNLNPSNPYRGCSTYLSLPCFNLTWNREDGNLTIPKLQPKLT